ncbi:hypothetical protein [Oceanobacillus sp. FSL H7-0719]|uniref:hypothetical protein n=1 Tax=Oceanobacillus sp. FSL H7-0719 TaxID=2954507 RepID=UPI0032456766
MIKYFVSFVAEGESDPLQNDVIGVRSEVSDYDDIKDIESRLSSLWFGDGRNVTLINLKKL